MATIGKLVVELAASSAAFQSDLGKAAAEAERQAKRIDKAISGAGLAVKTAFAGLAGYLTVGALVGWSKEVVEAAERLHNLSVETGSSVESLSRLQNIATISGKDFGTFQLAISRLAAGLAGSEEGSSKTAQALSYLGISAKDPATALQEIADKLEKYSDGASKAALARDLFGRGGVQFISVLHDMANAQGIAATTSTEQATSAAELAESLRKLQVQSTTLKNEVLNTLVPAIGHLTDDFIEGRKAAGGFFEAMRLFGGINPFKDVSENLADVRKQLNEFQASHANEGGFLKLFGIDVKDNDRLRDLNKQLEFLKNKQLQTLGLIDDPSNYDARDIRARQRPDLGYVSGAAAAARGDDPAKKALEGYIKSLDADIEQEKALLSTRNEVLAKYYEQGYFSVADYFGRTAALRQDNLELTVADYGKELAATDAFINARDRSGKLIHSEVERQDVRNKAIEIEKRLSLAQQEAGKTGVLALLDQSKAAEQFDRNVRNIAADVLDLQGKIADAAKIRIADAAAADRNQFRTDPGAVAAISARERLQSLQADLNASSLRFGQILQGVGIIDATVDLKLQAGQLTEIDAINEKTKLHAALIPVLEQEANAYETLAAKLSNPAFALAAAQLRLQIAQLSAQGDELNKKFRDVFEGSFTSALDKLVAGGTSARDIFRSLEKDVVGQISHIANQNISQALFGEGGPLGGLSKVFGNLFGGKGAGDAGLGAVAVAGAPVVSSFAAITGAAYSAAAALASVGGGGLAGGVGSLFGRSNLASPGFGDSFGQDFGLSLAGGGDPPVGKISLVGERGPELFVPRTAGTIIPNSVLNARRDARGGDTNVHVTVNVPGGTSRRSADQIAMATGAAISRAMRRNA